MGQGTAGRVMLVVIVIIRRDLEVRETLREIDRAVVARLLGHHGEDRGADVRELGTQGLHGAAQRKWRITVSA